MAHQANKHHHNCDIIVDDHAWLSTEHLPFISELSWKLSSRLIGPYWVVK